MNDEKKYTERDVVKREREAFRNGARTIEAKHRGSLQCVLMSALDDLSATVCREYPMPKVSRPRVVVCDGRAWRVVGHRLQVQSRCISPAPEWRDADMIYVTAELAPIFADLFANTNEEVEAES